jgi:hypothetical protein
MPMAYLFGKKFVGPITPTILALREELYLVQCNEINWDKARITCAEVCSIYFLSSIKIIHFYCASPHYISGIYISVHINLFSNTIEI